MVPGLARPERRVPRGRLDSTAHPFGADGGSDEILSSRYLGALLSDREFADDAAELLKLLENRLVPLRVVDTATQDAYRRASSCGELHLLLSHWIPVGGRATRANYGNRVAG